MNAVFGVVSFLAWSSLRFHVGRLTLAAILESIRLCGMDGRVTPKEIVYSYVIICQNIYLVVIYSK